MIDAYLDESGIHAGAAVCVIAGYFGGVGQWKKFELLWRRTLNDAGFAPDEFHAKDWVKNKAKYGSALSALARTITAYKIYPVSVGVVVDDFNSFTLEERRFLTGATLMLNGKLKGSGSPNRPYFLPFHHVIKTVASYAPVGGKANFFFGIDRQFYGHAANLFDGLLKDPIAPYRDRIGTVSAPLAKDNPQLQAADLLAHLTYLDMQEKVATGDWNKLLPELLRLCLGRARMRDDFVYFNKPSIDLTLRDPRRDYVGPR
jgi:hypothetical protein